MMSPDSKIHGANVGTTCGRQDPGGSLVGPMNFATWGKYAVELDNSLVFCRCSCNIRLITFKLISRIDILSVSCEIGLKWMPQDLTDD